MLESGNIYPVKNINPHRTTCTVVSSIRITRLETFLIFLIIIILFHHVSFNLFSKKNFKFVFKNLTKKLTWFWIFVLQITPVHIIFPTWVHLKNAHYLNSACSNPTNAVLVLAWVITNRSTLAVPISSTLAYNHTQDNH